MRVLPTPAADAEEVAPRGSYDTEEVRVDASGGARLAGTLTLPSGASRVPAVLLLSGSGPDDRDESSSAMPGYQPFWQIADALTRRGIAVLRLDDRGVGSSTGDFRTATTMDFSGDARAALAYLRSRPEIDGERIAILGHSEGGVVATMIASLDPGLKGVILLASPASNLRKIVAYQLRYRIEQNVGVPFDRRERELVAALSRWDVVADGVPRLKFSRTYDPLPAVERIARPVLILQGTSDRQVPPKHAEKLAAALRQGGNANVTVRLLEGIDHLFLLDKSGNPARYLTLTSRRIPGPVLDELGRWATEHLGRGEPGPSSDGT